MAAVKLIEYLQAERGRAAKLARALGVRPVMSTQWARGHKPVPVPRCMPIERATQGAVTRADLRPHDYLQHWPELAHNGERGGQ